VIPINATESKDVPTHRDGDRRGTFGALTEPANILRNLLNQPNYVGFIF